MPKVMCRRSIERHMNLFSHRIRMAAVFLAAALQTEAHSFNECKSAIQNRSGSDHVQSRPMIRLVLLSGHSPCVVTDDFLLDPVSLVDVAVNFRGENGVWGEDCKALPFACISYLPINRPIRDVDDEQERDLKQEQERRQL